MSANRSTVLTLIVASLFLALAVFAWGAFNKYRLDESSRDAAVALLQPAFSSGSADVIIAAAHPDWLASMPATSIRAYLENSMQMLGPLQSLSRISGESSAGLLGLPNDELVASYVVDTELGTSAFQTRIELRYSDGQWLVTSLVLDAPALMN